MTPSNEPSISLISLTNEAATRVLDEAETRFQAGDYAGAGAIFHRAWDAGDQSAGVRYATCLRLAGFARPALQVCQKIARSAPYDLAVRTELAWNLFEVTLQPLQIRHDLAALQQAASAILAQGAGPATAQAVFVVLDAAVAQGDWSLVATWCDRLRPTDLDDRPPPTVQPGAFSESPRLRWYRHKTRALLMLNHWAEARSLALQAQGLYPHRSIFPRLAAQALAGQGKLLDAYEELQALCARWPLAWPPPMDLARLAQQLGRGDEALRLACRAALLPGEDAQKTALFALLADIIAGQGEFFLAACHVVLARSWHTRQHLAYPAGLKRLEGRLRAALASAGQSFPDVTLGGIAAIRQRCFTYWQAIAKIDN